MLLSKIFLLQVFKPKYKSLIAQTIHVLSLNRRKHGMCEMVSKCLRKLDHYGRRSNDKKKASLSLSSVHYIYVVYMFAKNNEKDVTHILSVAEA